VTTDICRRVRPIALLVLPGLVLLADLTGLPHLAGLLLTKLTGLTFGTRRGRVSGDGSRRSRGLFQDCGQP
jgi:hypothetical protein